ncbi:choice-of-anchor A family protein [Streptomyces sp. UNOB3_S3]|uniref:choice-of-anchor A family protein n=1 Tax=Streptomyces sp. UNOB3_S3 TaxID=2871682 RepID=UPI001E3BEA14|nr:choice-of-anchor A family protein [Streptomyces sp. UNOB3_S3]MCC3776967.1 choice-of-anchor A family protein [Streptomyces sp. UNOB3_S3]
MNAGTARPPDDPRTRLRTRCATWLRRTAAVAATAAAALGGLTLPAQAAPPPGGLGPCLPGRCPMTYPPLGNGPFVGRDDNVNIFTGGDFRVRGGAVGAEGRVVSLGDFDVNKSSGDGLYSVGVIGFGSRVPPSDGADFLTADGDVTVAPGQRLDAERGVVRHAGDVNGLVIGGDAAAQDAARPYAALRDRLTAASRCYARSADGRARPATGTARNTGTETVFTGDGTSRLQVFHVGFDLVGRDGGRQAVRFTGIPAGATVLVNLEGGSRVVNTSSGSATDDNPFNRLREHLLWNVPDARRVDFLGTGQFQGSVLVGDPTSEATVTLPGMNGRFFTSGSLTHTSATGGRGGQEFHAYPFTGDLPDCVPPPRTTGEVTVVERDAQDGRPLQGARFQLWRESNGAPGLQTSGDRPDTRSGDECVSDTHGVCRTTVEPGAYYWQELQPPPGYRLPDRTEFGPLVLTAANAAQGVSLTVGSTPAPESYGTIHLVTKDARSGRPLPGARFELWRETNGRPGLQVAGAAPDRRADPGCVTDRAGRCAFRRLPPGAYHLRETGVPDGYLPPPDRVFGPYAVTVANARSGITVTLKNTPRGPGRRA